MTSLSNSLQSISIVRPKRRPAVSKTNKGGVSRLDKVFMRSLGRVCLVVVPVFFVCCCALAAMNGNMQESLETVESQNYELLTTNLQLKGEKHTLTSLETITEKVEDYGLFPPEKWQSRIL